MPVTRSMENLSAEDLGRRNNVSFVVNGEDENERITRSRSRNTRGESRRSRSGAVDALALQMQ